MSAAWPRATAKRPMRRRARERRPVHGRATRCDRCREAPSRRLRGRRTGVRQDHRAGGVFPAAGSGTVSIRCAFWPSPSPKRPRATCARSSPRPSTTSRRPARRLERAWVSTVHGFCARLLRENAVFAGIDPEFHVARRARILAACSRTRCARPSTRFSQEHPTPVRGLIRGLSTCEFEEAVLSAYDAMRGAGIRVERPGGLSRAARDVRSTNIDADPRRHPRRRAACAVEPRPAACTWKRRSKAPSAILSADTPREACTPSQQFSLQPAEVQARQSTPTICSSNCGTQIDAARVHADHRATTRRSAHCSSRSCAASTQLYRERKRQAGALDFADLEEFTVRLLEEHAGHARPPAAPVRPHPDGRVPGHQRPAGAGCSN